MRSMVEMATHAACKSGAITEAHKEATMNINGHTNATVMNYYIHQDCDRDVNLGTTALNVAVGPPPPAISNTPAPEPDRDPELPVASQPELPVVTSSYTTYKTIEWGANHPDYDPHKLARRAQWTEEEMAMIDHWFTNVNINGNTNLVSARCLKWVQACPDAYPVFHEIHISSSSRFKSGITKYLSKY